MHPTMYLAVQSTHHTKGPTPTSVGVRIFSAVTMSLELREVVDHARPYFMLGT